MVFLGRSARLFRQYQRLDTWHRPDDGTRRTDLCRSITYASCNVAGCGHGHPHAFRPGSYPSSIQPVGSCRSCLHRLDSARVARRAWAECASRGYGLANVCRLIGYEFQHHNALEDAKAAGHIMLAAMERTGLDLDGWLTRVKQPIDPSSGSSGAAVQRDGNPEGSLQGEVIVFTGALAIPRREAADLAASVGCEVDSGVTKKTTLLVVGDMDVQRLAGHSKSSKHRKAEDLTAKGQPIRIIRETDFRELVSLV